MKAIFRILGTAAAVAATGAAIVIMDKLLNEKAAPIIESIEFPEEAEKDDAEAAKTAEAYAEGEAKAEAEAAAPASTKPAPVSSSGSASSELPPGARFTAETKGIDPSQVEGTGRRGAVTKEDLINYASGKSAA